MFLLFKLRWLRWRTMFHLGRDITRNWMKHTRETFILYREAVREIRRST